ncbi:tRNA-(ms[2]io[6]A)-hydroxylase [Reinekea forsetii]|jgi:tRNA-(ms[2]io[6]A)-hydroxylase|uniref:tRNA-(Ms[2]io[6]A)-hydroxylase n=1 Tax=Reinekea forsetii TaxID=1336806 RepID=A0A2K8KRW7_9GAMM|nr:tRNA-(ms[2]io[6]A)-hydroxylase [Reinekea forsetii]ATX76819.1 tRNA-(ms[2]io[6]A)-hydroxylase [Reinekea forsetii]
MEPAVIDDLLVEIRSFLTCETPQEWLDMAVTQLPTLLIDHANCEKKAASTAMSLMFKYIDRPELLAKMSKLAREELVHFDQVHKIMLLRGIDYIEVSASRYAAGLFKLANRQEPYLLVDKCIIGAIVEARSCERFARLIPFLDDDLAKFYFSLLRSECRHYGDYLGLAQQYSVEPITPRVELFLAAEQELITRPDNEFRFHSGPPLAA